ncbi:hypothetical protein VZT92_009354 [Zoarces viviparus]|uniref:Protein TALPID3 n=1 Tax=Zoarces viviparus TaxID=48416 RepID=A0AAW1FJF3_ZOAVI
MSEEFTSEEFTLVYEEFTLVYEEFTLVYEEFTLVYEEFTLKSEEFTLKSEEFTLKSEAFTLKSEEFTLKSEEFTDQYLRGAFIVSTVTQQPAGSHLLSWTNHSEGAARRANETLREMGRLKTEMKMLLTPEDSLNTTISGPDHYQSQQNLFQSQQSKSQSQQTDSQQSQSHQSPFQSIRSQHCQTRSQLSQQFQSVLVQRKPVVPSTLEEVGLVLRQVRRQKKVLEENLEALLRARTGDVLHCQLDALAANRDWTEEVRIKKTVDAWISTSTRDIQVERSSEEAAMTSQQGAAGSSAHTGRGMPVSALRGSERGSRGPLQGAEPESYLSRLYGRAPYEGVRRTLKKSPYLRFSSPVSPLVRKPRPRLVESVTGVKVKSCKTQTSPGRPQHHDIIGSSHLTSGDLTVIVPMAIPLGRARMDSSRCQEQEVTSAAAPPTCSVVAVDDGASESQQLDAPLPPVDIIKSKSKEEEDEEDVFPGTEFLSDVVQQEELSFKGEEEVQLDGGPSPPPVLCQGPVFPPQTRSALAPQDQGSVLDLNLQRDVLENRLVEWVEQQLMSRMISEMYCPLPSDPAQNDSTDRSESEEQSATSDIVEAVGGGGLQLFVDSNMSVDSALIRQLVGEVLTEQVALLLGQRDTLESGPEPRLGSLEEDKLEPLVPTPLPTPPPSRETPSLATPPPSEPTSVLNNESPITSPEPEATPTSSPEPASSAGIPPAVHQAPPPLAWGDVELPLDEERPEEHLDTRSQLLVMSVAEEDPLVSSPLPPSSTPPAPSPSPPPGPRPESPSSSSEESSSTVTAETEAALKRISEGELLLVVNQLAAMTEEPVSSFSSSLQELHDMDFDPPSEGHVKGQDLLKTKMEQRDTQPKGCWRVDQDQDQEEVSVGEVRRTRTAQQEQTWSPGQMSQCADVSEVSFEATNQSSVVVGDLMTEPNANQQGGFLRMEVHLPFITQEEEETNSSTDDVF